MLSHSICRAFLGLCKYLLCRSCAFLFLCLFTHVALLSGLPRSDFSLHILTGSCLPLIYLLHMSAPYIIIYSDKNIYLSGICYASYRSASERLYICVLLCFLLSFCLLYPLHSLRQPLPGIGKMSTWIYLIYNIIVFFEKFANLLCSIRHSCHKSV